MYEHSRCTRVVVTFITQGLESFQGYQTAHGCPCKQSPLKCPVSFKFCQLKLMWICFDFPSKTIKRHNILSPTYIPSVRRCLIFLQVNMNSSSSVQFLRTIYTICHICVTGRRNFNIMSEQLQSSSPSGQTLQLQYIDCEKVYSVLSHHIFYIL